MNRIVALILALCLSVVGVTGCGNNQTTAAATYGDSELAAGVYIYYIMLGINDAYSYVEDTSADLLSQTIDGQNVSDWIIEDAKDMLRANAAIEVLFEEKGLTLSEDDEASIASTVESVWSSQSTALEQIGISRASLERVATNNAKSTQLQLALYGKGGEYELSEDVLAAYCADTYRRIVLLGMSLSDVTDEEELATRKELTETYYERAVNGEAILDLVYEENARRNDLTLEESKEAIDQNPPETIITRSSTGYPTDLIEQVFAAEQDSVQKYESDTANAIYQVIDVTGGDASFYYNDAIVESASTADYRDLVLAKADTIDLVISDSVVNRYTPKEIMNR
jgi:hypothetical protein